jgi:hypothetical protein
MRRRVQVPPGLVNTPCAIGSPGYILSNETPCRKFKADECPIR